MLHAYQRFGCEHIIKNKVAALFLDMGLGKTVTTLTAIHELVLDRFEVEKVLVIAPLRVARDTWPAELAKWEHLRGLTYSTVIGSVKERQQALNKKAHIYIINRENVDWLINKSGHKFDFDMVVIDELSSFKSSNAKRFKSLLKVRPSVKRMVGLTGTPASNGLMDLWAEFRLLDMGQRLGRYNSTFRNLFFDPDKQSYDRIFTYKPKPNAEQGIYKLIGDITISMRSCEFLQMPTCVMNKVLVNLDEEERKIYTSLEREMSISYKDKEIDAVNAAALSGKLLQMANGAVYSEDGSFVKIHDRKLDALEDLIEGANGKPVLVAYWFKHDLERIKERFKVRQISTSQDIQDWNAGRIPVAVLHPASAGHGLNLQSGGSTMVWFGLTWSLELYQQTNARLWRQGQKNTVVIHHIITRGTLDEDVMRSLHMKDCLQASIIDAVKARMGGAECSEKI
ncbi:MAG: DEAD/DEAH box helicase [Phascolarctobacterium sp.]|nr:DEAD/DEAH box helicase [Phascolarctobacterium sp.]